MFGRSSFGKPKNDNHETHHLQEVRSADPHGRLRHPPRPHLERRFHRVEHRATGTLIVCRSCTQGRQRYGALPELPVRGVDEIAELSVWTWSADQNATVALKSRARPRPEWA